MPTNPTPTVTFHLIRHADAGERSEWTGNDKLRPLTPKGREQAKAIADYLKPRGVTRLRSSPAARCFQTAEPLAAATGLRLEIEDKLYEGNEIEVPAQDGTAICAHGDSIPALLQQLGVRVNGAWMKKGCVWTVTLDDDGRVLSAGYWANRD